MSEINPDLAKQYQEILKKYSEELSAQATPSKTELQTPASDSTPVNTENISPTSETPPLVPPQIPPVPPIDTVNLPLLEAPTSPVESNSPKLFFYISLVIFIGVVAGIAYTAIISKQYAPSSNLPTSTPVPLDQKYCELNDKKYLAGESFPSADECNSCTCNEDGTVVCTELACDSSSSATNSENNIILSKINSILSTQYTSTKIESENKWTVDLTKSNNKINILVIKEAIKSAGFNINKEGGEAGPNWKEVYVNLDKKCELESISSKLTLTCSN